MIHLALIGIGYLRAFLCDFECGGLYGYTVFVKIKTYEDGDYMLTLIRYMEQYAKNIGYSYLSIGFRPNDLTKLAIYSELGYDTFIESELKDGNLHLYYSKEI